MRKATKKKLKKVKISDTLAGNKHLIGKNVYYNGFEQTIKDIFSPREGIILILLELEYLGSYYYKIIDIKDTTKLCEIYINCEKAKQLPEKFLKDMEELRFFDYNKFA